MPAPTAVTLLHLLPTRTAGAAENMAVDFLLLQRYPVPGVLRFRHYEWRGAAFTFGLSQELAWVRGQIEPHGHVDLCRRPTGGGIVDHRNDWTYSLVVPRAHGLYDERATTAYRQVHDCLAAALVALGQPAVVKPCADCAPAAGPAGVCFQRAETFDVVHGTTGAKIAGAAMKRNKHGLLVQGSIEKASVAPLDWDDFQGRFTTELARVLQAEAQEVPWPELNEDEVAGLTEQYSSPEWMEYR